MSNKPLGFPYGFFNNDNTPLDAKYFNRDTLLPYVSVAEAQTLLPAAIRYKGLTVNIAGAEYWWPPDAGDLTAAPVLKGQGGNSEIDIAAIINAATSKTVPVNADILAILDSATSMTLKKITWANIKAAFTKADVGLSNVDDTADVDKPVSTAQAAANQAILTQILDTASAEYNNLKKVQDKIQGMLVLLNGDDINLDQILELANAIKADAENITALTSGKVNKTDIYNALDYLLEGKVLDARAGKTLKDLYDALAQELATLAILVDTKANSASPNFTGIVSVTTPDGTAAFQLSSPSGVCLIIPYHTPTGGFLLQSLNAAGTETRPLTLSGSTTTLLGDTEIILEAPLIKVKGEMAYEADESATYTDRSLVDKEYVDNVAGDVSFSTITGAPTDNDALGAALLPALRPDQATGLKIWLDATDLSKVNLNVDKVSQITDKSSLANNVAQATPNSQPQYFFTGGLRDLPYIKFVGGKTLSKTWTQAVPYTVYFVIRQNNFVNNSSVFQFGSDFTNGIVQKTASGYDALTLCAGANWRDPRKGTYNNRFSVFRFSATAAGNFVQSVDDEPVIGLDTRFSTGSVGSTPMDRIMLGGGTTDFDMHEIIVLDNIPSIEDDVKIKNYFFAKYYPTKDGIPYYSFGDSITAGSAATTIHLAYPLLVAASLNAIQYNYALTGSDIGYPNVGADSLVNLYKSADTLKKGYASFNYGTNSAASPNSNWKLFYKAMINDFLVRGFDPDKLCIVTPPYQSNKVTKMLTYNQYMLEISQELGIRFADWWTASQAQGGDALLADGTHPTNAGHALGAQVVTAAFA